MLDTRDLTVLLLAGCAAAACSDATGTSEIDADDVPMLALEEQLRLGSVDDPEAGFSAIGGVDVDRDGNLYVFEMQDLQIRVYGSDGKRLRTIGRRGSGPGEFQDYARVGVVGDTIWTMESGITRRISLFTRDGRNLMTSGPITGIRVPLQTGRMDGIILPQQMMLDGRFTSDMTSFSSRRDPAPSGVSAEDTIRVPRVIFDAHGNVLDTIGFDLRPPSTPSPPVERIEIEGRPYRVPRPPSDEQITFALYDGRIFIDRPVSTSVDDAVFTVTRIDLARDTIFQRRFRYQPKGYSEAALDTIAALGVRMPTGGYRIVNGQPVYPEPPANPQAAHEALRAAMSFPTFQPPIRWHFRASDGNLWLIREDTGDLESEWLVLDVDGRPVGRLRLPRTAGIAWSNADTLWLIERDEFDVPWLVKYRFRPVN